MTARTDRRPAGHPAAGSVPTGFSPSLVCEVELSEPVAAITARPERGSALVLARWYSEPLAVATVPLYNGKASADRVARELWQVVAAPVAARLAAAGEPALVAAHRQATHSPGHPAGSAREDFPAELLTSGLRLPWPPAYLLGRSATLRNAPSVSVVVPTRDRVDRLADCLTAVLGQDYPDFEVIVVDNAPTNDAVACLVSRLRAADTRGVPLRHVIEPRPGVSWARNAGLAAATGTVVAYLDDDEHPDRHWLAELARGFTLGEHVTGVSGLVLPAELDTQAQDYYEQFGGHSKGRGFTLEVFDQASHARQHPLYPLPAFGVCASIAFDRAALTRIGGFDVALGTGSPARAGEETAAIADLMLDGGTFVYWPGAVMWHVHRRTMPELERQLNGYGSGLTAFYARALLRHPRHLVTLARLVPKALRDLRRGGSVRTATMRADYPDSLRRASRRGMLAGPVRYLRSLRVAARVRREFG